MPATSAMGKRKHPRGAGRTTEKVPPELPRRHELRHVELAADVVIARAAADRGALAREGLVELAREACMGHADVGEEALGVDAQRVAELAQLVAEVGALDEHIP